MRKGTDIQTDRKTAARKYENHSCIRANRKPRTVKVPHACDVRDAHQRDLVLPTLGGL